MKDKQKKILIRSSIVLAAILVICGLFFGTYYFIMNKSYSAYETSIKSHIENINSINSSTETFIKDQTIDTEKIRKELPSKIDLLSKEKEELLKINPTEKFNKNHEHLINGLSNNILLYKQISAILDSPESKDVDKSLESAMKYKDEAMNSYALIGLSKVKITLPEKALDFINNTNNYISSLIRLNNDKEIAQNKNSEFTSNIDSIVSKFVSLKTDFNFHVSKVRNKDGTYDDVLFLLDKNAEEFRNLKSDFLKIAVPQKGSKSNTALKKALDSYNSYLESFKYALSTEKIQASKGTVDSNLVNSLYSTPNSNLSDTDKNYESFLKLYTEFKNSNSK